MIDRNELRWEPARRMWDDGMPRKKIAEYYGITEKSFRTRIQNFRKKFGWFPARNQPQPSIP